MAASDHIPYNAKVGVMQGATALFVASGGVLEIDPGGRVLGGRVHHPLDLAQFRELSSASGLSALSSGTNPSFRMANGATDPFPVLRWTSAAGTTDHVFYPTLLLQDISTADPITLSLYGEGTSGQAITEITARFLWGVGAVVSCATAQFTSAPSVQTFQVASGFATGPRPLGIELVPTAHASGSINVYGAELTYKSAS